MNLTKYLTINKANRANPFKDTPELSILNKSIDSLLRNASHHGAMKHKKGMILYRSGGTGAEHKMTYTDYLMKCNDIILASSIVFMIEIKIGR